VSIPVHVPASSERTHGGRQCVSQVRCAPPAIRGGAAGGPLPAGRGACHPPHLRRDRAVADAGGRPRARRRRRRACAVLVAGAAGAAAAAVVAHHQDLSDFDALGVVVGGGHRVGGKDGTGWHTTRIFLILTPWAWLGRGGRGGDAQLTRGGRAQAVAPHACALGPHGWHAPLSDTMGAAGGGRGWVCVEAGLPRPHARRGLHPGKAQGPEACASAPPC
jgi:hypothetical protein